MHDIETQLPEIFSRFYSSIAHRTCSCLRHRHAGSGPVTPEPSADPRGAPTPQARGPWMRTIRWRASRTNFIIPTTAPGRRLVYLCGHSLGLQPKSAAQYVEQELKDWQRLGVLGHHAAERPWIPYHEHAAAPLAALVGAEQSEVVAMNSLTVNLHLMMVSFFRPGAKRNRVLIEKSAFPSDRYAVVSQLAFHGLNAAEHLIEIEPRPGERDLANARTCSSASSGKDPPWRWCCCPAFNI